MPQAEMNFGDYLRIFRKRKFTIFLTFLCAVSVTFFRSGSQTPLYISEARVKIVERRSAVGGQVMEIRYVGDFIQTQEEVIKGRAVAERAAHELGFVQAGMSSEEVESAVQRVQSAISTGRVLYTNVIQITATTEDPHISQEIAEAVAQAYIQADRAEKSQEATSVRLFIEKELEKAQKNLEKAQETLATFQSQGGTQKEQIDLLRSKIAQFEVERDGLLLKATSRHPRVVTLEEQITHLRRQLEELPSQDALTLEKFRREVDDSMNLVSSLKQKYNDAKISESEKVSDVVIVDHAKSGAMKASSSRATNILLGAAIGLLLGLVFAFIRENLDTSIGAIEDVESFLGVSVLGVVPNMPLAKEKQKSLFWPERVLSREDKLRAMRSRLVTQFDPRSPEAESYHTLRTNIYSVLGDKGHFVILFTSSGPREGKSITAGNFAVASAQMGKKTLLVDCDMRRPVIHQIFGLDRAPGLFELITGATPYDRVLKNIADILIGDMEWEKTLQTPHMAYLNFITAGHLPANPPELLNSQEMNEVLRKARNDFDLVILDCPPILPVTDALLLGPKTDGVILVYQAGRTARGALKRSKLQLDAAKAKVLGVVLNDVRAVEMETGSSYYYRYRKYYSNELEKEAKEQTP